MPAIPLVAAGIGGAFGLIGAKKQANAAKQQAAIINPLVQQQADASRWSLDQAKSLIPQARETLQGPLNFWNTIFKGDRNAMSSVLGPENDAIAGRSALMTRQQSEFAPRGGRRTLMLGEQPFATATDYNRSLLSLRPQAADKVTGIGQILAQLGLGTSSAATGSGSVAINGALGSANLANQSAAATSDGFKTFGSGLGQILFELQKWKFPNSMQTSGGGGNS